MKAVVVEQPGEISIRDIPESPLGPYDARCQVLYGAVCTGTDLHLIDNRFPWPVSYPTVLGHESIGRVVGVGAQVRNFHIGDLVTRVGTLHVPDSELALHWGGFVEYAVARDHWAMREDGLPPEAWCPFRINQVVPAEIDPRVAPMLITWRETFSYMTRMGVEAGATVLILGSGGTGLSFTAHARNLHAGRVITIGSPARDATARAAGATDYHNYTAHDLTSAVKNAIPDGVDFIIDSVGKQGQMDRMLPLLKPGGTVGVYGLDDWGAYHIDPSRARGTFTYYNNHYDEAEVHDAIVSFVLQGKLDATLWFDIEHPWPLHAITDAFDALRERKAVKALIQIAAP